MHKWIPQFSFVLVFVYMAWRLFEVIDRYAVNVVFRDHWDYLTTYVGDSGILDLFRHQHAMHRQGVGYLLTKVVADATDLDMRAESFAIGGVLCLACALGLWWKRRLVGRFHWGDLVIPLMFLTPLSSAAITVTPNPAHGAVPLMLLMASGLAWTLRNRSARLVLIPFLLICLVHTGFGIFAAGPVLLLLGMEVVRDVRRPEGRPLAPSLALLASALALGSFFIGWRFMPAVPNLRFPDPNWPLYPVMMARALGSFLRLEGSGAVLVGFVIIFLSCWVVWHHAARLLRTQDPDHRNAITLVVLFSLLFLANMAVGRISMGTSVGTASRYMILLVPLYFGLYLQAYLLSPRLRTAVILLNVLVHAPAVLPSDQMEQVSASYHRTKTSWRDAYLATGSIEAADTAAGEPLHPNAVATQLKAKLEVLEAKGLSFFRDHTVSYELDARLVGRWYRSEDERSWITLDADGGYRTLGDRGGRWRIQDDVVSLRGPGYLYWSPIGRYEVTDNVLVLHPVGGSPAQRWERR